ncbi:cobaltochelatase subunit CobN [Porphyromonas sp.]|uniref:cobaltochelatase subunit CobN n=1 Tax=Porphyromonas sp. TaxID=1924944 RepID=UPI0026DC4D38|nr:cobaltochelatase subunit CobN [Porphyromonas sp.]MDO4771253.1 cobaltochelatase subunit CobN [Porphyromonas sp.]
MKRRNLTIIAVGALVVVGALLLLWNKLGSTTQVALVNFPAFQSSAIVKSNQNEHVEYKVLSVNEFNGSKSYDFVLVSGMGLKIDENQRAAIQKYADKGHPIKIIRVTNPANNICNLDSITESTVMDYLNNGNRKNYVSMANYIRKYIDKKTFFAPEPNEVIPSESEVFYHLDEEVAIKGKDEFDAYLKKIGHYHEGAPRIAVTGAINDPYSGNKANLDSMIVALNQKGFNVYPILSGQGRLAFLNAVQPQAIIYFPHGRMSGGTGDQVVEALKRYDAPLFIPLTVMTSREKWVNDPMGMYGGFMSQSLVMPELDGAIYPYVVNTQEENAEGIVETVADPVRLHKFVEILSKTVALQSKPNKDKKLAIYYFKGPGQNGLAAQGIEVVPSLYNVLKRLKSEGYTINLPASADELFRLIMKHGPVLNEFTEGAIEDFMKQASPLQVDAEEYDKWLKRGLTPEKYNELIEKFGPAPGEYMSGVKDGRPFISIAAVDLGNVVLLPQPMAGIGGDSFAIVHGANSAPPHPYVAAYLWAKEAFHADAMMHFGTHGSLEFTPQKQVALGDSDWPDALVGTTPHFYYYTIANVGESMMAKRRSYATTISYLNPPFEESRMRASFDKLRRDMISYEKADREDIKTKFALDVKREAIRMGIHRELRLDSILTKPYTDEEMLRLDNFAEEIANEKISTILYVTGVPYTVDKIKSSVIAMSSDPIGYSKAALDRMTGKLSEENFRRQPYMTEHYLAPAKRLVNEILNGKKIDSAFVCSFAGITIEQLREAAEITKPKLTGMAAMMEAMQGRANIELSADGSAGGGHPAGMPKGKKKNGHPSWIPKFGKKPDHVGKSEEKQGGHPADMPKDSTQMKGGHPGMPHNDLTPEKKAKADAIMEIARTLFNVNRYRTGLAQSPEFELSGIVHALNGGYIAPTSGGDAVANPSAIPTGRNLYSINAEVTPTELAWEKGKRLAESTLETYVKKHGEYPKKVSYTFWSSEFIETGGATIAQVFYILGVEPVRDVMGRVSDVRLIPSEELGRPRVDVLVQTSGQFRDLAASRLNLISKAVSLAAAAGAEEKHTNFVHEGNVNIEKRLVEEGLSPKDAREWANVRVFGGINGMYGTGIQEMMKAGDKWEDRAEIAEVYLNNMGAAYASTENWGAVAKGLFRAAVENTDVIIQPRQSNTWGALSLDHVFEFMGGLNLTIAQVTGKEPEALFADYRNRNNVKMQDLKEAIGIESRSTILNPYFVKEATKGGNTKAGGIAEIIENTYGWEVSKPEVIDDELWDNIHDMWIEDTQNLGTKEFFSKVNPAALEQITAVMLETVRKGMWNASPERVQKLVEVHNKVVQDHGPSGAGFAASNQKLRDFITQKLSPEQAELYNKQMDNTLKSVEKSDDKSIVLKEDKTVSQQNQKMIKAEDDTSKAWYIGIGVAVLILLVLGIIGLRKRNKRLED